jgi:hypothetical protein
MHPLTYNFAYHVESTTLDNGDYDLVVEQDQELSEDPTTVAKDLIEAPNQSSENLDTTAPNPTQEGKPRT